MPSPPYVSQGTKANGSRQLVCAKRGGFCKCSCPLLTHTFFLNLSPGYQWSWFSLCHLILTQLKYRVFKKRLPFLFLYSFLENKLYDTWGIVQFLVSKNIGLPTPKFLVSKCLGLNNYIIQSIHIKNHKFIKMILHRPLNKHYWEL